MCAGCFVFIKKKMKFWKVLTVVMALVEAFILVLGSKSC